MDETERAVAFRTGSNLTREMKIREQLANKIPKRTVDNFLNSVAQ